MFDDPVYDLVELSFFICSSLCDQKVEVRMKVYPASECLDHRNDARSESFFCGCLQVFDKCLFAAVQACCEERSDKAILCSLHKILRSPQP